jgi:hypothetical protein
MSRMRIRTRWAANALALSVVGLATILSEGCKRYVAPAPAQTGTVRSSMPRVVSDLSADFFADDDPMPKATQPAATPSRRMVLPQAIESPPDPQKIAAQAEELQRQQDGRLWQQQEAASQKAQEELNQEVERAQKEQDQMENEPRIQDAPGPEQMGLPVGLEQPGQEEERIQDAPGPAQTLPGQPGQDSEPRIQDAPGPAQTMPQQP